MTVSLAWALLGQLKKDARHGVWRDGEILSGKGRAGRVRQEEARHDRAQDAGYVERRPDPDDRRAQQVVLTKPDEQVVLKLAPLLLESPPTDRVRHLD